jgi:hypothetical protein
MPIGRHVQASQIRVTLPGWKEIDAFNYRPKVHQKSQDTIQHSRVGI